MPASRVRANLYIMGWDSAAGTRWAPVALGLAGAAASMAAGEFVGAAACTIVTLLAFPTRTSRTADAGLAQTAFQSSGHAILIVSGNGTLLDVNAAAGALLGYEPDELVGQPAERILEGSLLPTAVGIERVELNLRSAAGDRVLLDASVSHQEEGGEVEFVITGAPAKPALPATPSFAAVRQLEQEVRRLRDELRIANERVNEVSLVDELTGVFNKPHFAMRVENMLRVCARAGQPLSLVLLDIDGMTAYNDEHGRLQGDRALRAIATILRMRVRPGDVVSRIGPDEFAILMPLTDASTAAKMAATLRGLIHQVQSLDHSVRVTVASATSGPRTLSPHSLCAEAEEALELAKGATANRAALA